MKKILEYGLSLFCWLNAVVCYAVDRFEILPDLPDPLQAAEAAGSVSKLSDSLEPQSVGNPELGAGQVIISLFAVILLIYLTGIIYAKLNKLGYNTLKKQNGDFSKSHVSVVSTTALGNNKTLHVVELDGKRMLIGASSGAIQLIKDLGDASGNGNNAEYSQIEIPTIKIPKIEIPKIEIPAINFSKLATKIHKDFIKQETTNMNETKTDEITENNNTETTSEGIIDTLFTQTDDFTDDYPSRENTALEHKVDPDEYALYKKYLS